MTPAGRTRRSPARLLHLDDFNVALRDASGEYHSFKRTPSLKVVKNDPFAAHHELLDQYTDKNMHDIVAYLETLEMKPSDPDLRSLLSAAALFGTGRPESRQAAARRPPTAGRCTTATTPDAATAR